MQIKTFNITVYNGWNLKLDTNNKDVHHISFHLSGQENIHRQIILLQNRHLWYAGRPFPAGGSLLSRWWKSENFWHSLVSILPDIVTRSTICNLSYRLWLYSEYQELLLLLIKHLVKAASVRVWHTTPKTYTYYGFLTFYGFYNKS
jgi:hypothetical protein